MRFKDFEIRPTKGTKYHDFEVVKWYWSEIFQKECCYVLAWITWNAKEPCWEFKSVGMRFINDYEEGLCEYIKKFMELVDVTRQNLEDVD